MISRHVGRQFFLASSLLLTVSSTVRPQTPRVYCAPGATYCFAIKYAFTPYQGPRNDWFATNFTVWLQNLQGSRTPDPTPAYLNTFFIRRDNGPETEPFGLPRRFLVTEGSDPLITIEGNAQAGDETVVNRDKNLLETFTTDRYDFLNMGIAGCNVPHPDGFTGPSTFFFAARTCPRLGLDGWARLDFWLGFRSGIDLDAPPDPVSFSDFDFSVSGPFFQDQCWFGAHGTRCPSQVYDLVATPEPTTVALLATGLLVVAVVWRRRTSPRTSAIVDLPDRPCSPVIGAVRRPTIGDPGEG